MAVDVTDREAVERRFISEGTPTLIYGYSFRHHVLPRALSFMVAFGLVVLVVTLSLSAFTEFVVLLLVVLAAVVWFGLLWARRSQRPLVVRSATNLMLVAWFAWPVVVPLLIVATQQPEDLYLCCRARRGMFGPSGSTPAPAPPY
jgi:ABC-type transport system involved in cytochrome c biogenesis permease component